MPADILIIDDEPDIRNLIEAILKDEGYMTRTAASADEATASLRHRAASLVILDIWLEGSRIDGLELLSRIKKDMPSMPVIMISGHGNIETAVSAIKKGAYDFIEKPFKSSRLLLLVERALEAARLRRENEELKIKAGAVDEMIGTSSLINQLRQSIDKVAASASRVMITGPAGSGKELVARQIHFKSHRAAGPFVVANCAALEPANFEREIFGVEPSENASQPRKIGLLEKAHRGTLLLDKIADMPMETQGKIVRTLQEQGFERVGGRTKIDVDVRVIATSTRDLNEEIKAGRFRSDLFYRLNVVPIKLPSLAERREDIPLLARYFLSRYCEQMGQPQRQLADDTVAVMQSYDWPGNVRQLQNVIEWLTIMTAGREKIHAEMLPPEISMGTPVALGWEKGAEIMTMPLREAREIFEREYLRAQVSRFGGNVSRTASFIEMERSALHRKLKSLGINNIREDGAAEEIDIPEKTLKAASS